MRMGSSGCIGSIKSGHHKASDSRSMYAVYVLSNDRHTVFYTGVTSDLYRRITEHKKGYRKGFTSKYNVTKLLFFETHSEEHVALKREAQIKDWRREKKADLINSVNPKWVDLYDNLNR